MRFRVASLVLLGVLSAGCGNASHSTGNTPGYVAAGVGYGQTYEDVRVLTRDDCTGLRDHQVELAVVEALADAGGAKSPERLTLEARLRNETQAATEAWIQRCSGRRIRATELRCMRNATTPRTFNACGQDPGPAGAPTVDAGTVPQDAGR